MTADARDRTTARIRGRRLAALSAALLFATAVAPAASWGAPTPLVSPQVTASIPITPTDWSPGNPGTVANPVSIPQFDPSLGKLLSVNFALNYSLQNNFSMTFTSPSTITVGATNTSITVDRPNDTSIIAGLPADLTKTDTVTSGTPTTVTFPTVDRTGSATPLSLTDPADLALFTAAKAGGTIALPVFASAHSVFSSTTGNGTGMVNTSAGAELIVTYSYAPVVAQLPEPSTVAILGIGMAAALFVRRKRA
jgi:PEP-CTERM motif